MSQFRLLRPRFFVYLLCLSWQRCSGSNVPREGIAVIFRSCRKINTASYLHLSLGAFWK
jgi:hypothetical protein